jgi:peptidoglycan hydrolase CwlO-like protein
MEEQKKHRLSSLDVSTSLGFFDCVLQDYSSPRMPSDVIRSCLFRKLKSKSLLILRRVCKRFNSIIKEEKWFLELLKTTQDRKLERLKEEQKELRWLITSYRGRISRREKKSKIIQKEVLELQQDTKECEEKIEAVKKTKKEIERSQKKLKKD